MAKRLLFFVIGCCLLASCSSNWRKLSNQAEEQMREGNLEAAASAYEEAWEYKQNKPELIYKSGEAYYELRDYRKAADAYQHVRDMYDDYPLAGLKYARSLKQDGQYDQAIQAFREFNQNYTGTGKAVLEEIVRTEIRGAELAKSLSGQQPANLSLQHLGSGVNSDANEFAPLSFSDNILYFSSTMGGKARIYRSQKLQGSWAKASVPENFPVIQGEHFCHGSLSPDGSRFYFTICGTDNNFNNTTTRCEIYVIKRISGAWSPPERLPNTINLEGTTATQPFVLQQGGRELLYFASNRSGGRGGLDLWYASRDLNANNNNFSNPVNLGPTVNTLGDEMTPFFDTNNNTLYFASNGHVSMGGFDIFKTQGTGTNWSNPENAGLPYNSSADDYYYVGKEDGTGGFFASNRVFAGEKLSTQHDDLFEFGGMTISRVSLQASVFDRQTNQLLDNFTATVYEVDPAGTEMLLYNRPFTGGAYTFDLMPGKTFRVEVASPGYQTDSYTIRTDDPNITNYGQSLFLDPSADMTTPPTTVPPTTTQPNPVPTAGGREVLDPGGEIYTSRGLAPSDQQEFTTTAPRYAGTYYKVQLVALSKFNPNSDKFDRVKAFGQNLTSEYLIQRQLNRILIGPYFTEAEARQALSDIRTAGGYPKAYIVRYDDGQRYGRVNF